MERARSVDLERDDAFEIFSSIPHAKMGPQDLFRYDAPGKFKQTPTWAQVMPWRRIIAEVLMRSKGKQVHQASLPVPQGVRHDARHPRVQ